MRYSVYVFDFDYTLADATPGIVESINYALDQLGLGAGTRDEIRRTVGMTLQETFRVLTGIADNRLTDSFTAHFKDMADKVMADNTVLFDDTTKVLAELKQMNYNTAIVTSKFHYRINEVLFKYGISELIDYIVGFEDVTEAKPSPEGLLNVIRHFGIDKEEILYVGDNLIDADAAAKAGVDFAAVTTGTTTYHEFAEFPYVCVATSLSELFEYVIGYSNPNDARVG